MTDRPHIGFGIAHGFATLGTIGFEGRFDYAAIGTVSNVASRLCDEAKAAQIPVSSRVLMAVEDAVTASALSGLQMLNVRYGSIATFSHFCDVRFYSVSVS